MRAEVISIGDEMTSGQRLDTNSQWLSERLGELGIPVAFHTTVADNLADNIQVFRIASERADIVISSGGLGPTADDLTRQAIAAMAGVELVEFPEALAHIEGMFARRKRAMPPSNRVQALFPLGSRMIHNPHGSAPGIDFALPRDEREPARIFALPGVPAEMKEMWEGTVRSELQKLTGGGKVICHYRVKCFGVGESDLEQMLPDIIRRGRVPSVGITVSKATITLRITAEGPDEQTSRDSMRPTIDTIHTCLGTLVYGYEDDELQHVLVRELTSRSKQLGLIEIGTGGLITSLINDVPGGRDVLRSSVIASSTKDLLPLIPKHYSQFDFDSSHGLEQAAEMFREQMQADYVLLVGPFPPSDTPTQAPGQLDMVLAYRDGVLVKSVPHSGHPDILRPRSAKQAMNMLRLHLLETTH